MKYLKTTICLLLVFSFLLTSCKKDPIPTGTASYIPARATNVTGFDLKRLMDKADFEAVKDMEFYQEFVRDAKNPALAEAIKDPTKSGIDLTGKIYVSTDIDKNDHESFATHILVPLSNADDFEKLVTSADLEFTSDNGLNVALPDNDSSSSMVWDDRLLAISFSNNNSQSVLTKAKKLFDTEPEESLAYNKDFAKSVNTDHDMTTWMSTNTLAKNPAAKMALGFVDIDPDALKDNYIHGYGDFEEGKIIGHTDFYFNNELKGEVISRFFKDKSETDFSKILPAEGLTFATSGAINFRGIDKFLSERPQNKKYADFVLNDMAGFERKELLETLNGDMIVAGYAKTEMQSENFMAAMAIKNEGKAKTMLENAVKNKKIKEVEPGHYKIIGIGGEDFSIQVNKGIGHFLYMDNMLVYSPNNDLLGQIKNGQLETGGKNINNALNHFKGQSIAGWLDFNSMGENMVDMPNDFFKDVRYNMNIGGADFILETNDPNKNSLKVMFEMIEQSFLKNNREAM